MSIFDSARNQLINWLLDGFNTEMQKRSEFVLTRREYRVGSQKRQLAVRQNKFDDNIVLNFTGLIVSRSVSNLFGGGVKFILPNGDESPEAVWLNTCWSANNQEITLHRVGTYGTESGTCFVKIVPDGAVGSDGKTYPRLIVLDPATVTVDTMPEDVEVPIRYTIRFNIIGFDGKEVARKQVVELDDTNRWTITDYQAGQSTGGHWQIMGETMVWGFDFPPIIHWHNLPAVGVYGQPDITEDVIELQDRINFIAGNQSKIIRMAAHPIIKAVGIRKGESEFIDTAPGNMLPVPVGGDLGYLEPSTDITKSLEYVRFLRQALFDITQQVDLDTLGDKLGSLTNFGLKVLFADAVSRIHTKQELYGAALIELNRRMLVIGGFAGDAGSIQWGEWLPESEQEESNAIKQDMELGLVSKETAATMRGYDYQHEKELMAAEQVQTDNVGAALLRAFNRGGGANA
jgi:hypothetical protein